MGNSLFLWKFKLRCGDNNRVNLVTGRFFDRKLSLQVEGVVSRYYSRGHNVIPIRAGERGYLRCGKLRTKAGKRGRRNILENNCLRMTFIFVIQLSIARLLSRIIGIFIPVP